MKMLPLNQLEALSENYAEMKQLEKALDEKKRQLEDKLKKEEYIKINTEETESKIMNRVRNGGKSLDCYIYIPKNIKNPDFLGMAKTIISNFKDQGFHIGNIELMYDYFREGRRIPNVNVWDVDELESIYETDQPDPDRVKFTISWENFKPNPHYNAPNFEEKLNNLRSKVERMKELNAEAYKVLIG